MFTSIADRGGVVMGGKLTGDKRVSHGVALSVARDVCATANDYCETVNIAGSLRRLVPTEGLTIGDVDIVVIPKSDESLAEMMLEFGVDPYTKRKQLRKGFSFVHDSVQVDVLVADEDSFGAAMLFLTGSAKQNIQDRAVAKRKGWQLTQYGLWNALKQRVAISEEDIHITLHGRVIPLNERG